MRLVCFTAHHIVAGWVGHWFCPHCSSVPWPADFVLPTKVPPVFFSPSAISTVFPKHAVDVHIQYQFAIGVSISHIGSGYCSIDFPFWHCTSIFSISNGDLSIYFTQSCVCFYDKNHTYNHIVCYCKTLGYCSATHLLVPFAFNPQFNWITFVLH